MVGGSGSEGRVATSFPAATRGQEGGYRLEAAISNIGGMDSGPATVRLYADANLVESVQIRGVSAGDSLLENRAAVGAEWEPRPGPHELRAVIMPVAGATILDGEASSTYYVQ